MEKVMARNKHLSSASSLEPYLARIGRRLRLREGWRGAQRSFWLAGLGALLAQLAGRLWPLPDVSLWSFVPACAWLLIVVSYTGLHRRSPLRVAQQADLELGLKERLSTSVALVQWGHTDLLELQRVDALATARQIDARRAFPLGWMPRQLLLAAGLIVAALISARLPNPMDVQRAERAAVAQAAHTQA
jgi:hypothetical protein